ncbi:MAG: hypothetical protein HY954_12140 [Deltaproteobacteria bacterium]|nr:hypothetical protein [Deltaproteobacteria bacterium]
MRRFFFTGLFLLILVVPMAGFFLGIKVESSDRRELAGRPALKISSIRDRSFFSNYEKYFSDHFAFRGWLIRAKSSIDLSVFRTAAAKNLHVGLNGWLYFKKEIDDFKKDACGDRDRMRETARKLKELENIIESSGKKFIFFVAPNKMTVYPEHAGVIADSPCGKSRYDLLLEAMEDYPLRNFLRLDTLFGSRKGERQLYMKNDSHWSANGAKIVADEVMARTVPGLPIYQPKTLDGMVRYTGGDLAEMTTIRLNETFQDLQVTGYPYGVSIEKLKPLKYSGWVPMKYTVDAVSSAVLAPRAIFFCDSFMFMPLKFLQGSFERIDVIWSKVVPVPEKIEELQAARIVVIEAVERDLGELDIDLDAARSALLSAAAN